MLQNIYINIKVKEYLFSVLHIEYILKVFYFKNHI